MAGSSGCVPPRVPKGGPALVGSPRNLFYSPGIKTMASSTSSSEPVVLDRPRPRRPVLGYLTMLTALLLVGGGVWAWESGHLAALLARDTSVSIDLVEVERGDVVEFIVENGTLESATNTVVRCEVEALMGMVGGTGTQGMAGGAGGRAGGTTAGSGQGGTAGGAQGGAGGGAGGSMASAAPAATAKSRASCKVKAGSSKVASKGAGGAGSSGGAAAGGPSGAMAGGDSSTAAVTTGKPVIRSFSYMVTPHMPLRGASTKSTTTTAAKSGQMDMAGGGRGGRGGGGGGRGGRGGGGGMFEEEKPGSTRIVSILPEGTLVKKDQIVCELDSAAFKDELKAQLIRHAQAKSWVDQARTIYEVNLITLREYRDGIFPQDRSLIRQYIQTCTIEKDRAERNLAWTRGVFEKGLQTEAQLKAAELSLQQANIALGEAQGMLVRLEKFTGPKIIKSLEAKVKAIESDRKNQDAAFELENQRLARLQKCIDGCTLKAPEDGILVYYQQTNGWGRVEQGIEQGVTVREGQPIFQLPDPKHMRVKAKVNETKVSHIRSGQRAVVRVDAFPDRPMQGTVAEVTAISTPVNGPFSDVRIYYATVNIDAGFDDLRPGLTAEVFFRSNVRNDVPRLPIQSIRIQDGKHFVAVHSPARRKGDEPAWKWSEVQLGLSDPDFVEIVSGVKEGDRVVANPQGLPAPEPLGEQSGASAVASVTLHP
ncbi:MAG: HlyD family efflux transporter periplasmic adaptor subunit [Isosphaeraceae bacterium]